MNELTLNPHDASALFEECVGGVTAPRGFRAAGVHCGLKRHRKDVALIVSDLPAYAAAMFTSNKVQAAPVVVSREQLRRRQMVRAVVINSGNANAATGEQGIKDAWSMIHETAKRLNVRSEEVLVASTGIIGQFLPMEKILRGIEMAVKMLSRDHHTDAAQAIMTTDTFPKEAALRLTIDDQVVTIGGMAKGSGMIAPNLILPEEKHATMLAFITTDAAIEQDALALVLKQAVNRSFNRISVDGDMSTNDMVIALANGSVGNAPLVVGSSQLDRFAEALEWLLIKLAKMIVRDGEGATKLIEINISGARTEADAVKAASAIARSNLVKTAIHGEDANWGRILAAIGYSGIDFEPSQVEIFFDDVRILGKNFDLNFSEDAARQALSKCQVKLNVHLNGGSYTATFWTCDLSKEYVYINASYRS